MWRCYPSTSSQWMDHPIETTVEECVFPKHSHNHQLLLSHRNKWHLKPTFCLWRLHNNNDLNLGHALHDSNDRWCRYCTVPVLLLTRAASSRQPSKWSEWDSSLFEVIKKTRIKENLERYFSASRCPILTIDDSNESWKHKLYYHVKYIIISWLLLTWKWGFMKVLNLLLRALLTRGQPL